MKYKIIITRNRQHYRFIKALVDKSYAIQCYNNLIKENLKVKFDKHFVNYAPCSYQIELLSPHKFSDVIEYEKDELGRNMKAPDRNGWYIWRLKPWLEPEYFTIYGLPGYYDYNFLYNIIKKTKETIGISTIQNLLILDIEGKPLIITLKNIPDAIRLYQLILSENFNHILGFGVMSKINCKGFYKIAKNLGIPIRMFYTNTTNR